MLCPVLVILHPPTLAKVLRHCPVLVFRILLSLYPSLGQASCAVSVSLTVSLSRCVCVCAQDALYFLPVSGFTGANLKHRVDTVLPPLRLRLAACRGTQPSRYCVRLYWQYWLYWLCAAVRMVLCASVLTCLWGGTASTDEAVAVLTSVGLWYCQC